MAFRSGAQYLEGVARRRPVVFLGGDRIQDLQANPVTKTVVEAMAKVFDMGLDPAYQEVMTAVSPPDWAEGEPKPTSLSRCQGPGATGGDGIVVRGAKQYQSGAYAADETLVLPGLACRHGEEDYALAFAVANGTPRITYIAQYTPFTAERKTADSIWHLGNPIYGQRETCLMVFDEVFIPWDRMFLCGEVEYTQRLIARFVKMHRMNCGGACKVGFADLIIGASQLLAEYTGLQRAAHIVEKVTQMVKMRETWYACAIAAANRGIEEPPGSGVWLPDDAFSNVAKLNTCYGFWELMARHSQACALQHIDK